MSYVCHWSVYNSPFVLRLRFRRRANEPEAPGMQITGVGEKAPGQIGLQMFLLTLCVSLLWIPPCAFCSHSTNGSKFAITLEDGVTHWWQLHQKRPGHSKVNLIRSDPLAEIGLGQHWCQMLPLHPRPRLRQPWALVYQVDVASTGNQNVGSKQQWRQRRQCLLQKLGQPMAPWQAGHAQSGIIKSSYLHTQHPATLNLAQATTGHNKAQQAMIQWSTHTFGRSIHARYMGTTTCLAEPM